MASDDAPSWSPDGSELVFERTDFRVNGELLVVNADGTGESKLASGTYYNANLGFSPDGKIVYAGRSSSGGYCIYTMNADGTGQASITDDSADDISSAWGVVPGSAPPPPDPRGCTVTGAEGRGGLHGTSGPDVICGLGGDDTIRGLGGGDTIYGDDGDDILVGDEDNDRLVGGPGKDTFRGGTGKDTCKAKHGEVVRGCP